MKQEKILSLRTEEESFSRELSPTILTEVLLTIFEKKGSNPMLIDLRGAYFVADYVLIAEGDVERHVSSIGQEIIKKLRELGEPVIYTEGLEVGDWVVLDCLHLLIHLFTPRMREKYQIEELFSKGKLVEISFDQSKEGLKKTLRQ